MDFEQAERQFQRLQAQCQQGELDESQYRVEVAKLLLRDAEGMFWMLDAETGAWFCNRGDGWIKADPGAEAKAEPPPGRRRGASRLAAGRGGRWRRWLASAVLVVLLAAAAALVLLRWPENTGRMPAATAEPTTQVEVVIASPPEGGIVALGQEVGIEAMLQIPPNLASAARAELQVDGEAIAAQAVRPAAQPGQAALPLSFPWRPKAAGEHEIAVIVWDNGGEPLGQATIHLQAAEESGELLPEPACTPDAAFLADVTVPAGAEFGPGARMEKVWQVRNSGTCAWGVDYDLVRIAGQSLGAAAEVPVPPTAAGEVANLEVSLTAPEEPGSYGSSWRLRSPRHIFFGPLLALTVEIKSLVESDQPPAAPAELAARLTEDGQAVRLTWEDRSDNEDAFRVYRQDVEASIGLAPANSQLFVDRSAICGRTYRYAVVAFNAAGSSAATQSAPVSTPRCAVRDMPPSLLFTVVPTEVVASSTFTVVVEALDDVAVAQVLMRGEGTGDAGLDAGRIFACGKDACTATWPLTWTGELSTTLTLVAVARDSAGQESAPARAQIRIRPPR